MKKIILNLSLFLLLSIQVHGGFLSSALGTAAGNSVSTSGGSNKNIYYGANNLRMHKTIQKSLSKLGFYGNKFDGNLNSFDTRSAIENFQYHYNLDDTGVLGESEKQDLLYMHDLFKNYSLELKALGEKNSKRLIRILKAFDKLEKRLSHDKFNKIYLSTKFNKEIDNSRLYRKDQKKNIEKKVSLKNKDFAPIIYNITHKATGSIPVVIKKVVIKKTETKISFEYLQNMQKICWNTKGSKSPYLTTIKNNKRILIGTDNVIACPKGKNYKKGDMFSLIFKPLPQGTSTFHLIEGKKGASFAEGYWNFLNVVLPLK